MRGLQKYSGSTVRRRASSPKLVVMNTALMSAVKGLPFEQAKADHEYWGRLVETAVGAHLLGRSTSERDAVYYWRDGSREVDYVVESAPPASPPSR